MHEPAWRMRVQAREVNQHLFTAGTRPLLIEGADWSIRCRHQRLPLASGSIDEIEIVDVLEYVRNDRALYAEIERVARPGGVVRLRAPNVGPLAGIDSINLYRYLTDVTKRGVRTPESDEIGFRRHFSPVEVGEALGPAFTVERSWTSGLALSEIANLAALISLTWRQERSDRYNDIRPKIDALARFDRRLPARRIGFWLWVEARRS